MKNWNGAPSPPFVSGVGGCFEATCVSMCGTSPLSTVKISNQRVGMLGFPHACCWGISLCPVPSPACVSVFLQPWVGWREEWSEKSQGCPFLPRQEGVRISPLLFLKGYFKIWYTLVFWYLVLFGKIIGIFLTLNYSFLLHFVFFLWLWKRLSRICQSAPIVWALQVFKNESWLFTVIQILGCLFISLNLPCVVGMQLLSQFFVLFFLAHFIFFPNFGILEFS